MSKIIKKVAVFSKDMAVVQLVRKVFLENTHVFFASDVFTLKLLIEKFPEIFVLVDPRLLDCELKQILKNKEKSFACFSENIVTPEDVVNLIRKSCDSGTDDVLLKKSSSFLQICGDSDAVRKLREKIILASKTDMPVLLTGESGSGKTLAANAIHELSKRGKNEIYYVNISGVSEGLVESELFGTLKGAFTDAQFRKGYFESAFGSTLFFDEIGDISLLVQKKLLQVIEKSEFRKVGSDEIQKTDVRLIFATNVKLEHKIKTGEFRQDLYYRIKKLVIEIPPLRERASDIPLICERYLSKKYEGKKLSKSSEKFLCAYNWPGNIRQLESCLDRAAIFCPNNEITPLYLEF